MTPMEQVKARIESMRKTNPDSNQLCKLLDMVEGFVKEERLAQENITAKPTAPASLVTLCKEMLDMLENPYYSPQSEGNEELAKVDNFAFDKAKAELAKYLPTPVKQEDGLVEALEKLARLGNGSEYGNSEGNRIAQEALAKFKENK